MLDHYFKFACLTLAKDKTDAVAKFIFNILTINKKIALLILSATLHHTPQAQHSNVKIDHSEVRILTSDILKQNFRLYVHLPVNYLKAKKSYSVMYILDGHWLFPMVTGIYSSELGDGAVPEMIMVGITWGGVNSNFERFREMDYTPTSVGGTPNSGNAAKFLASIKKEIIPFIESKYRVEKKDRTLMAASLGGLFAAYLIFQDIGLFSRYIIASPALDWDNSVILNYEQRYSEKSATLNARIAICGGDLDRGIKDIQRLTDKLKSRNYKGLILTTKLFEGSGHSGSIPEGLVKGLQAVFEKSSLSLDTTRLDRYVGTYQRWIGDSFKLFREGGRLFMQYSDDLIFHLEAEDESRFYIRGVFMNFEFKKDEKGTINGVEVSYDSGSGYYKKIE